MPSVPLEALRQARVLVTLQSATINTLTVRVLASVRRHLMLAHRVPLAMPKTTFLRRAIKKSAKFAALANFSHGGHPYSARAAQSMNIMKRMVPST